MRETAARHGAPPVCVAADATETDVQSQVRDGGDGFPAAALAAICGDEETILDHASGCGLWTIAWGAERLGGTVTFENDDGAVATVLVPRADGRQDEPAVAVGRPGRVT